MNKKILLLVVGTVLLVIAVYLAYKSVSGFKAAGEKTRAPAAAIDRAQKLYSRGEPAEAIKGFESVTALFPDSPQSETAYLALGAIYEKKGELAKARDSYRKLIEKFPAAPNVAKVREMLDNINIRMLFSGVETPDSFLYEVQKGDTLTGIAKKFHTTPELISKANGLKDSMIRFGRKLKIAKASFSIVVDKSQNILALKSNGGIFKHYSVSTGKDSCTPSGNFKIVNKIIDPPWYPPAGGVVASGDPKNVLGSRWMGLSKPSYGIHGTIEPETIGRNVTEGCIRMKNSDVNELYAIVPEGTEVVIID